MSKKHHTPGKWRLTERKIGVEALVPVDHQGITAYSRHPVATTSAQNPNREADALLIAAAPEMLALLERVPEIFQASENWTNMRNWLADFKQVAAKVRGEAA